MIRKHIDYGFWPVLVDRLSQMELHVSRDLMIDGHKASVIGGIGEFFTVFIYVDHPANSPQVALFSFFPLAKELYIGYAIDTASADHLREAFIKAYPGIAVKDNREALRAYARRNRLEEWTFECATGYFAPNRLEGDSIPDGLFKYELRNSEEDESSAASIEDKVYVNYYGTLVTAMPLPTPLPISVPYIPLDEEGDIDLGHIVRGKVCLLGTLKVGDRFHNGYVSPSLQEGTEAVVSDPCFPNLTITSLEGDEVVARDAFQRVYRFPASKRVWVVPEINEFLDAGCDKGGFQA